MFEFLSQLLFPQLMTSNLLAYSQLQLPILRLRERISYQLPITNSHLPGLCFIQPKPAIYLASESNSISCCHYPLLSTAYNGCYPPGGKQVNITYNVETERLFVNKSKSPWAHRPRKNPVSDTHTQTLQTGYKLFTKP